MNDNNLARQMNIEEGLTYLNHAAIGPLPRKTLELLLSINKGQSKLGEAAINFEEIVGDWDLLRKNIALLINGNKDGVAITSNTASALHIVADGLQHEFAEGKNIVITESEFTTNSYCWQQVVRRHGMQLRVVSQKDYELQTEDWEALIDKNTCLISLSHVQFSNGYRSDLNKISRLAHDQGAYVVVDAIQSLGVIPFDIQKNRVDFVASGGYKWLLGPFNIGFFYTRPEHLDNLDTILVGWFSSKEFMKMSHNPFTPWNDARKFQQSPIINMKVLNTSIETIIDWDVNKSFAQIISLQDYFISKIEELEEVCISSSLKTDNRSGIIKVEIPSDELKLVNFLKENKIIVAFRKGGIRISPHAYNTKEDIDKLVDVMRIFLKRS